jgi:hypothetical protein
VFGSLRDRQKRLLPRKPHQALLVSVDGMHTVNFVNCANGVSTVNNGQPYCPALAALGI